MSSKLSSMMVPDEPTKHPKTSSRTSVNIPVKAQDKNTPSSSEGSSSNQRYHDQIDHQDVTLNQDFGNINDDIVTNYRNFKKFDIVDDYSDHILSAVKPPLEPTDEWEIMIGVERSILQDGLPDTIYVRAYKERMDLLRAVIKGAEATPYHDGLYFFDIRFPEDYPNKPPIVNYHSGGLRIHSSLSEDGWVGVTPLWIWKPLKSTILQVLVYIQGMILNEKPYFNKPRYDKPFMRGTYEGEQKSLEYNEVIRLRSLKTMVYTMNKPPKNFEDLVIGHFYDHARGILTTSQAYVDGIKVGNSLQRYIFKKNVEEYISKTLTDAFRKIGVKGLRTHKSLPQKIKTFFSF